MSNFKFFWTTHKWVGIIVAIVFINISVTGFLLLVKKDYDWIQPPTLKGQVGETNSWHDFLSIEQLFEIVFRQDHPDFQSLQDIDRVDFRPNKRVHKVRSVHNHMEMQVDAVTGAILSIKDRKSDLLESLHDGSFYGEPIHAYLMPAISVSLLFLVLSGLYLWIEPSIKRRRRKKRALQRIIQSQGQQESE